MIEFRQIRYFLSAAEHGSFRKAALASESRSQRLVAESEILKINLAHPCFIIPAASASTLAGQRFLRRVRIALQQIEDGVNDVAAIGRSEEGIIKVGIFSSLASGFLFELLKEFDRKHPRVTVELIEDNPAVHVAAIWQLQLDVASITGTSEWPDCDTGTLWSERVFAVPPTEHRLATKQSLYWHDLAGREFIVSDACFGPEIHDYAIQRLS